MPRHGRETGDSLESPSKFLSALVDGDHPPAIDL